MLKAIFPYPTRILDMIFNLMDSALVKYITSLKRNHETSIDFLHYAIKIMKQSGIDQS